MKKNIFALVFVLLSALSFSYAQTDDQRAISTKIADLLARFPAQNSEQLNASLDAMNALNKEGFAQMVGMMSAPGAGNNTNLEYAIDAYSTYVMKGGQESRRAYAVEVYCNALGNESIGTNRVFLVRQLQRIGKDDATSCLQAALNNETLTATAARALAQINSPASQKVLLQSLQNTNGKAKESVVEALGYTRLKAAVPALTAIVKSADGTLRKTALYALSRIADPSSASLLQQAAKQSGFRYSNSGETAAYFNYISELSKTNKASAARLAGQLMQQANASKQVHPRIAALKLMTEINGSKSLPVLYRAMQDTSVAYRGAALQFSNAFRGPVSNRQWLNTIPNAKPEVQAQIINHLASSNDRNLLPVLQRYLASNDDAVKHAAIEAIARIGQEQAIVPLLQRMRTGSKEDIQVVKNALLRINSIEIGQKITTDFNTMPPAAKVAILEVLAARRSENATQYALNEMDNSDTAVKKAAIAALPSLVSQQDLPKIYPLLGKYDQSAISSYQQAVIAASSQSSDSAARSQEIIRQMQSSPIDQQSVYLDVLASLGGKNALDAIGEAYRNGNEKMKMAAVNALAKNNSTDASSMLYQIAKEPGNSIIRQSAVNGYIDIIARSSANADQKILMLRNAMELATSDAQKKRILRETSRSQTFLGLVFAGKYIDDPALQQDAANAIMNIALSNKEYTGNLVRELMTKTLAVKKGADSDYQKEAIRKHLADMPTEDGFVSMFNEKDLTGWKGLVADPIKRASMNSTTMAAAQKKADSAMRSGWEVQNGLLVFTGKGDNLATIKQYDDFEMLVDWKITKDGDAGIYLRGTPQVQIWDTARRDVGAQVGSGGLYNNQKNMSKPLVVADNAVGDWNTFRIIMKGEKVTVYLNGVLVTDQVPLENYWNRNQPIFPREQIELQAHGTYVAYRNLFIKELDAAEPFTLTAEEKQDGFTVLFDGTNLDQWTGNKESYVIENGDLVVKPGNNSGGNLFTSKEYADFHYRFEFQLTPGANNGLGIRAPLTGDAAYEGMELQILDNDADIYKNLKPFQYHGSVYGIIPAKRGFLKPLGEWNYQEVIVKGAQVKVILNGEVIVDGNVNEATKNGTPDKREHPGLKRSKGHIGFLGHGSPVRFRNIRIKEL